MTRRATIPFPSSRGRRTAWLAVLALSPLAYWGATMLQSKLAHGEKFTTIGKDQAIRAARSFAQSMHVDTAGWQAAVNPQGHKLDGAVLRDTRSPALARVLADPTLEVTLTASDAHRWIKVNLTTAGAVVGFLRSKPEHQGDASDERAARAAAESYLRSALGPDSPFTLGNPEVRSDDKQGWNRSFIWNTAIPGVSRAKVRYWVETSGNQVTSESSSVQADQDYQDKLQPSDAARNVLGFVSLGYFLVLGAYAVYRYVKRSTEKEISHRRTLLLVAAFVVGGVLVFGGGGIDTNGAPATGWKGLLYLAVIFGIGGLFFGIPYGAGEGDLREAFPGRLASLDAFLSGKVFSANVARSLLAGGGVAGWMLVLKNLVLLGAHAVPDASRTDLARSLFQSPLGSLAFDKFTDIALMSVFGLMLPLTFLRPRIRKNWLFYLLLAICSTIAAVPGAPDASSFPVGLSMVLLYAAVALVPFFTGDVLASVSSIVAFGFVGELLSRSVISDTWHQIAYTQVLPAGVAFLAVELYFAWRGRVYQEEEVRPLYARHLAERMALTAEIGAARQAQLRLLPDRPPYIAGLSIAGSCLPAREVGGDFFDYYALDDHRLGVFLAEGGNRELGSAMAIALAKGFVMYSVRLDLSAVEILRRLHGILATVLRGDSASMNVLYATIDARTGAIRYARTGLSPLLLVNGSGLAEEIIADPADGPHILHGAGTLHPGDALFFYTDGWAGQIKERTRLAPGPFLQNLEHLHPDSSASDLHDAALAAAVKRRQDAPPDDVTTVVVRLEKRAAQTMGGIA